MIFNFLLESIFIYISNLRIFCLSRKIWKRLFMVTPCTKSCQSLYQILANLVPDPGNLVPDPATPPTKLCHTLYQTLAHLVPDPCTPCTRPCQTLYHTLSHLVPDPATPPTKLCQYTASRGLGEAQPHASFILIGSVQVFKLVGFFGYIKHMFQHHYHGPRILRKYSLAWRFLDTFVKYGKISRIR